MSSSRSGSRFADLRVHDLVLDVGVHGQQLDDLVDELPLGPARLAGASNSRNSLRTSLVVLLEQDDGVGGHGFSFERVGAADEGSAPGRPALSYPPAHASGTPLMGSYSPARGTTSRRRTKGQRDDDGCSGHRQRTKRARGGQPPRRRRMVGRRARGAGPAGGSGGQRRRRRARARARHLQLLLPPGRCVADDPRAQSRGARARVVARRPRPLLRRRPVGGAAPGPGGHRLGARRGRTRRRGWPSARRGTASATTCCADSSAPSHPCAAVPVWPVRCSDRAVWSCCAR